MLIGLLSATSGNIAILGKELDKKIDESFPSFGMVLDNDGLYDRLNCYDNLELYARIYSISNRKKVINDLLEKVGLIESSKKVFLIFLRECVKDCHLPELFYILLK